MGNVGTRFCYFDYDPNCPLLVHKRYMIAMLNQWSAFLTKSPPLSYRHAGKHSGVEITGP